MPHQFSGQQLTGAQGPGDQDFLNFLEQLDQRLGRERVLPEQIPLGSQLDIQNPVSKLGGAGLGAGGGSSNFFDSIKSTAQSPAGSAIIQGNIASTDFGNSASVAQGIGGTIGGVAGTAVGGPVGGAIGSVAGQAIGGFVGGDDEEEERKKEQKKRETEESLRNAALFFARSNARKGIPSFF